MQRSWRKSMQEKILNNLSPLGFSLKMAQKSVPALRVCELVNKYAYLIDPDDWLNVEGLAIGVFIQLGSYNIRGTDLSIFYQKVCQENIVYVIALLRSIELEIVSIEEVKRLIKEKKGFDKMEECLEEVRKVLVNFTIVSCY